MNKALKILILPAFLFIGLFSFANQTMAAEMFFVVSDQKPAVGELFKADLFINTNEENINAMAGKVIFSSDLFELKEVRDGNSMINLWVDRPAINSSGEVSFSGITPGGYKGQKGFLFSLIFSVLKSGSASIKIAEGQALLNDGKGTEVKLTTPALVFQTTAKSDGKQGDFSLDDKTPPESFVPEIAKDKNIADDKWFVAFVTQDKESGIDHYEVQENRKNNSDGVWKTAVSPYVLEDQSLRSYVYIKAVDKAGNATLATVNPKKSLFSYYKLAVYGIMLLIVLFAIRSFKLWRKRGG